MAEGQYANPVVLQRADPFIYKHSDGYYYFTASVPEYDRIEIRKAKTIAALGTAAPKIVWTKHLAGIMSANIWAPEIHYIAGKWYIYFAAARQDAQIEHRMYVLENVAGDPLEGEWKEKGQIKTKWESFSLDETTFEHKGTRYLLWAQKDPDIYGNSNLYIAKMENPWTISGEQVRLTKPEFSWEIIGFWVNEGPAVLKKNKKIFLTYSASATDYHYCIGMLTANIESDLLAATSWNKAENPVFKTSEKNSQYGPGHNSFTVSEDGNYDILVYHARNYKQIIGDPLNDPNRHTRAQRLNWNADGSPDFGEPVLD
jgi:GH43 family beta-xylosidase